MRRTHDTVGRGLHAKDAIKPLRLLSKIGERYPPGYRSSGAMKGLAESESGSAGHAMNACMYAASTTYVIDEGAATSTALACNAKTSMEWDKLL
jgi:hypothetical protein